MGSERNKSGASDNYQNMFWIFLGGGLKNNLL